MSELVIPAWVGKAMAAEAQRLAEGAHTEDQRRRLERLLQERLWREFTLKESRAGTPRWPATPEARDSAMAAVLTAAFQLNAEPVFSKPIITKYQRDLRAAAKHLDHARRLLRSRRENPPNPLTAAERMALGKIAAACRNAADEAESIPFVDRVSAGAEDLDRRGYLIKLQNTVVDEFGSLCRGTVAKIATQALQKEISPDDVRNWYKKGLETTGRGN